MAVAVLLVIAAGATINASVAQLVEHHVANVKVMGSNPITRSIFIF